jgi:ankyrin repeat protein
VDYSDIVGEILDQVPTVAAAVSARDVLVAVARTGELPAARALGVSLARKLGHPEAATAIQCLQSLSGVLADDRIPPLLRIYLLGFLPREFFFQTQPAVALASAVRASDEFDRFQRMVRRDDILQHEALKAYWLSAFVTSLALSTSPASGSPSLAGGWQNVLDGILADCRVVPGGSADTGFAIGRDLIAQANGGALFDVLHHELGHHDLDIRRAHRAAAGVHPADAAGDARAGDALALAQALPGFMRTVAAAARRVLANDRLSVLASRDEMPGGACTRISLTRGGGAPIPLPDAVDWAAFLLDLLDVAPSVTAVAYSPRGVFHVGFPGKGRDPDQIAAFADDGDAARRLEALRGASAAWLGALTTGRLEQDGDAIPIALGLGKPANNIFTSGASAWEDMERCREFQDHRSAVTLAIPDARALLGAAVRSGDVQVAEVVLEAGIKLGEGKDGIAQAGSSFALVKPWNAPTQAVGTTAAIIFALIELLHTKGLDLDAPVDEQGTTLLLGAVQHAGAGLALLLRLGANVNRADRDGKTPLHAAVGGREGDLGVLRRAGAHVDARNGAGMTPLAVAVGLDAAAAVAELLEAGADARSRDVSGATPLLYARSVEVARRLVSAGANPNDADLTGLTALMSAAERGLDSVVQELIGSGADPEAADDLGTTALHRAAGRGDDASCGCLASLLDAGADIDETTRDGVTPLMVACRVGSLGAVRSLLKRGADVRARTATGNTALLCAFDPAQQWSRDFGRLSRTPEVARELVGAGADVNEFNDGGFTALHLAARIFDLTLARTLIELGASPNVRTADGETPLMFAVAQGHAALVTALIDAGADVNAVDAEGNSALHVAVHPPKAAALRNSAQIAERLISRGARDLGGGSHA